MQQWFSAYLLTCLVEIPIVVALSRGIGWRPRRVSELVLVAWALQVTHPLLWLIGPSDLTQLVAAELVVVVLEGGALAFWAWSRAGAAPGRTAVLNGLLIAFIANATSVLVGVALAVMLPTA